MESELKDRLPLPPAPIDLLGKSELELVRVTEAAALAAGRMTGRGDQDKVKNLAASAMLQALEELGFRGQVALGPRGDGILSAGSRVGVLEGEPSELGHRNLGPAFTNSDECHLIAHVTIGVGHVEHDHVHGHQPDNRNRARARQR